MAKNLLLSQGGRKGKDTGAVNFPSAFQSSFPSYISTLCILIEYKSSYKDTLCRITQQLASIRAILPLLTKPDLSKVRRKNLSYDIGIDLGRVMLGMADTGCILHKFSDPGASDSDFAILAEAQGSLKRFEEAITDSWFASDEAEFITALPTNLQSSWCTVNILALHQESHLHECRNAMNVHAGLGDECGDVKRLAPLTQACRVLDKMISEVTSMNASLTKAETAHFCGAHFPPGLGNNAAFCTESYLPKWTSLPRTLKLVTHILRHLDRVKQEFEATNVGRTQFRKKAEAGITKCQTLIDSWTTLQHILHERKASQFDIQEPDIIFEWVGKTPFPKEFSALRPLTFKAFSPAELMDPDEPFFDEKHPESLLPVLTDSPTLQQGENPSQERSE